MHSAKKNTLRHDGRTSDQLRPVSFVYEVYEYAAGSVLFEMGKTKVLCAVSLQTGVPQFLRGKNVGWLTAEYALLPTSTLTRTQRESSLTRKDGRSVEIARFIGRCFRAVVDLSEFSDKTITIDCDVLQADGGTRTAAISGSFLALRMAQEKWLESKIITKSFIKENIAALSVGIVNDNVFLDLNYHEDSMASADFNFVITQSDKIIEIQGGAESAPLSWDMFELIRNNACKGILQLFSSFDENKHQSSLLAKKLENKSERIPFFSLKNRQQSS